MPILILWIRAFKPFSVFEKYPRSLKLIFIGDSQFPVRNKCMAISIVHVSLSGKTEYVDDDVVVLEGVLLAKIAVILGVPEAACAHVESAISLL